MRADRLLSVLLLLQAHGRLTGRELARRLEVSQRTIHRDMDALSAAGVPVFALRGARGGWQLDEGWRTRVPGLEEAELRALLMAQPRVLGEPRLVHAAERALDKLVAALPLSLRGQAASIRQRLHVDTTGWRGSPESLPLLPTVQEAVSRDRKLAIRYRPAGKEPVERTVDPLGLVAKAGTWYLVAATPDGLRTYRVSRLEQARLLDEPSRRPADFDLAGYWKESTEEMRKEWARYGTTLRVAASAARSLRAWRPAVALATPAPDPDGWETLQVGFEDEEQAAFIVLGLGPRVEVIAPEGLRKRLAADVAVMLQRAKREGQPTDAGAGSYTDPVSAEPSKGGSG